MIWVTRTIILNILSKTVKWVIDFSFLKFFNEETLSPRLNEINNLQGNPIWILSQFKLAGVQGISLKHRKNLICKKELKLSTYQQGIIKTVSV